MKNSSYIHGHEYVDLGLPSGLKWATCNVGAIATAVDLFVPFQNKAKRIRFI